MKNKIYSSYKEIDTDLKILKLQKEIDQKKLALAVEKTIDDITPNSVIQKIMGTAGSIFSNYTLISKFIIPIVLKRFMK